MTAPARKNSCRRTSSSAAEACCRTWNLSNTISAVGNWCDERVIAQADPPGVDRHRDVDMLVGIDPDNHLPNLGLRGHGVSHRLASSGAARGLARVGGQDCDGPWVRQAPMGSRPIRSAGCRTIGRWAVTDRSMTRTVGQSSCGSGHRPPAPTGVTERPRQAGGIMLTVKLAKSESIDPQDTGPEPVVNPPCWASETAVSLNLTIPLRGGRRHRRDPARPQAWWAAADVYGERVGQLAQHVRRAAREAVQSLRAQSAPCQSFRDDPRHHSFTDLAGGTGHRASYRDVRRVCDSSRHHSAR